MRGWQPPWWRFARDESGVMLRDYALAVVLAAATAVAFLTILARPLYHAYVRYFGP